MRRRTAFLVTLAVSGMAPLSGASADPVPPPAPASVTPTPPTAPSPRLGGTFISPMGEPFRGGDGDALWFAGADADRNGRLTLTEFRADAYRFFKSLDVNKDGEIDPDEITRYETEVAPEIRVASDVEGGKRRRGGDGSGDDRGSRGGGRRGGGGPGEGGMRGEPGGGDGIDGGGRRDGAGRAEGVEGGSPATPSRPPEGRRGAGRYGYFDLPEPVSSADTDFNRGVSAREFDLAAVDRFRLLDSAHNGYLTLATLPKPGREGGPRRNKPSSQRPDGSFSSSDSTMSPPN